MKNSISNMKKWISFKYLIPKLLNSEKSLIYKNSIVSSLFTASLEMARKGEISIRQDEPFGEIFLKKK